LRRFSRSIEAFKSDEQGARHGLSLPLGQPVPGVGLVGPLPRVEDDLLFVPDARQADLKGLKSEAKLLCSDLTRQTLLLPI
jgi:hypothetical protein